MRCQFPRRKSCKVKFHRFLKAVILCQTFFYKPWLVQRPRRITLYLSEKTFLEAAKEGQYKIWEPIPHQPLAPLTQC